MPTTSNFGWTTPADTDLVKDGAAAIRTLGNGVDTSFVDLKGGTTGQVLAKASGSDLDFSWVTTDDANAIQNAIVDAKGDLIAASAADTPARLAVGNNGETLVADSSTATGLRYQGNFAAGKNKITNGDFGIWQRGTSFSNPANGTYCADRYKTIHDGTGATRTISQQSFTAGTAPVAGYEAQYFMRYAVSAAGTGNNYQGMSQYIEDVRTLVGQAVTVSFWAKADASRTVNVDLSQYFGSGGSSSVYVTLSASSAAVTTSWQRFTFTGTVPSISGKTIGAGSALVFGYYAPAATVCTIDIWGVQVEASNVATSFQTATGTLAGELAACQRYYYRHIDGTNQAIGVGANYSSGEIDIFIQFPVTMRGTPSLVIASGTDYYRTYFAVSTDTFDNFVINLAHSRGTFIYSTTGTAVTSGVPSYVQSNNASASIAFNAEL